MTLNFKITFIRRSNGIATCVKCQQFSFILYYDTIRNVTKLSCKVQTGDIMILIKRQGQTSTNYIKLTIAETSKTRTFDRRQESAVDAPSRIQTLVIINYYQ